MYQHGGGTANGGDCDIHTYKMAENIRWSTAFIYINSSLASVLISHFILDLRSVYRSNANSDAPEHSVSSVRFASAVVANLGASLDASWVTGRSENCDDADEEPTQFSNNPLGVGLLDLEKSENDASTPLEDAR
ncbi:unnamed protein product [Somion occarium]|uniref:Uncharacterized protein n=1 Tax=Somion occarium TaxID=3059160 RepID=A0ABP1CUD2_9APHY